MRKNVIALMLVLPLLFMVVFSQMMNVPLGVKPTVSSVKIRNKPEGGTRTVELLDYGDDYEFSVDVYPQAAEQTVSVSYEKADGTVYAEDEEVPVEAVPVEGKANTFRVKADEVGGTVIRVTSKEGNLSDSFAFNVVSSRAYDYGFGLYAVDGEENLVAEAGENLYRGAVEPGTYSFSAAMIPAGTSFAIPRITNVKGAAVVDEAKSELRLNFAGEEVSFDVVVPGLPEETATKHVELAVDFENGAPTGKPILINGAGVSSSDEPVSFRLGSLESDASEGLDATTTVYVQTWYGDNIQTVPQAGVEVRDVERIGSENYHNYKLSVYFPDTGRDGLSLDVVFEDASGEEQRVTLAFTFEAFSFKLRANIGETSKLFDNENGAIPAQALLLDTQISFSAVPDFEVEGIVYKWELHTERGVLMDEKEYEALGGLPLSLTYGDTVTDYSVCNVKAVSKVSRVLLYVWPARMVGEEVVPYTSVTPMRVAVDVMENILSLAFVESGEAAQAGNSDGKVLSVAGNHYETVDGALTVVSDQTYAVDIRAAKASQQSSDGVVNTDTTVDIRDLKIGSVTLRRTETDEQGVSAVVSRKLSAEQLEREGLALGFANTVDPEMGKVKQQLTVAMRNTWQPAEVTISVEWAGNESFGRDLNIPITLNLIKNAVRVQTSEQLFDAADKGNYAIVLGADIKLGTSPTGGVLPEETRRAMLKTMYSTYNTEYYRNIGKTGDAYVKYVIEFKQSVYGNGYSINAEYFTNAKDGTGNSVLFQGPLDFVRYADTASVAAQDNIAFLCRTDGVTIYNTVLLGCSDESLGSNGEYDLTKLNNVGTTLEINADVNILNCRVRNGRNVVRVYGGNRDVDPQYSSYFIGSLSRHESCDNVRIHVRIEGSVLAHAREFIVKAGSNLALHAGENLGDEPWLTAADGSNYAPDPQKYLDDEYFYSKYVITDLTIKDCVFDASGLFSVGVESNFAGPILNTALGTALGDQLSGAKGWGGTGGTSFAVVVRLEGDVRLYDWKDLSRIDSSTLIQISPTAGMVGDWLRLNIAKMLEFVCSEREGFSDLIDGENHVHGGIAFYGGGKNYSQIDLSGLNENRRDLKRYEINIDVLADSPDEDIQKQGQLLPLAAGTQPFRFFMYDKTSANNYAAQEERADKSVKSVLAF